MLKHDFLYLIWKHPKTKQDYIVGKLSKEENGYSFEYCQENKLAIEAGWHKLDAFPEEICYHSEGLFTAFANRLPGKKRRNIDDVLKKYGLTSYDGYELLRKSCGRLPIDTYEFIDPTFLDDEMIKR